MHRTLSLVVCLAAAAGAQEEAPGFRQRLEQDGLSAGAAYTTEAFTDGRSVAALGNFTANLELDLTRLRLFRGHVFTSIQALHGSGADSRLVGAAQCPSNLADDPFRKWGEAWYADSYAGGKARVRAGRQYADREFGVVAASADFLNAAFGALPTAPMPTYPDARLGAAAWIAPSKVVSFGAGAYQGGFGVVETRAQIYRRETAAVGAWRQGPNRGIYATVEHRFAAESDAPGSVFARWGRAPSAYNELDSYAAAGLVYLNAGLAVTTVHSAGKRREVVCEIYYKRRIRSHLSLQPDAQYVANPAGDGSRRPARRWIAGIRLTLEW